MGKLYGIGVGPGDPELLTLKAHRILNAAETSSPGIPPEDFWASELHIRHRFPYHTAHYQEPDAAPGHSSRG